MEASPTSATTESRSSRAICIGFALACLLLHSAVNWRGGYGYFRDELYYLACSHHLAAGYVDQPPFSIHFLALVRSLFGDGLFALRLWPALASAAVVYSTGLMARRLGASPFGVGIACLAASSSPIALGFGTYYSMNSFDLLFWIAAAHLFMSVLEEPRTRTWILLGLVLGLGLLNKISVSWLILGLFVGLALTPHRTLLRTSGPWIAGVIAVVLFSPFVIWNVQNHFAHLEFIRNASEGKYSGLSVLTFLKGQILINQPLSLPLWLLGLVYLLRSERVALYRPLGWVWVTACVVLAINGHSKPEYLAAAYPILYASGGAAIGTVRGAGTWCGVKIAYAAIFALTSAMLVPIALPILPIATYVGYAEKLGVAPHSSENNRLGTLPQFYADMFGWEEKVAAVAHVFARLSPEEQADCAIFGDNYGRSGAIDFFGKAYGLPDAIGDHNNYWLWGTRGYTGRIVLVLGRASPERTAQFQSVEEAAVVPHSQYCMPYENDLSVFVCRGLKAPLSEVWPKLKHFQ
jgi:hypothetical protein